MKSIVNLYKKNEYMRYSLWFILCFAIILCPLDLRYRSMIEHGDAYNQSFPLFVYIGQWLRACLRGEVRLFDFRLGLGDDVIYALNWHGFGDITQIISIIAPYEYAEYAYDFVMVLKFWLAGISFLIYIRRYVQHREYRIIGALLYAFNTYTITWGFNCWMFLAPMMTFPLILSGIDAVCSREKRLSVSLLAGLWIQALNGFYFLYVETVMAVLYFGVREFVLLPKSSAERCKKIIYDGLRIFGQALLAVSLAAPMLLPSVVSYFQSSRTERETIHVWNLLFFSFDYYRAALSYLLIPDIYRNLLTLGPLIVLGILIGYLYRSDRNKIHRSVLMLMTILYCIPLWGNMMNGFAGNSDRWLFGFILIATSMAIIGLDTEIELSRKNIMVFYAIYYALIILFLTDSDWYSGKLLPAVCYGVIGIILPFAWNRRAKYVKWILPLCAVLIVMSGFLVFVKREVGGSGYLGGFKWRGVTKWEVDQEIDSIVGNGEPFERRDVSVTCLGSSLIKNYYGTTEYLSTLNGFVSEFYRDLYISPGASGATWILKGLDERIELRALLSAGQEANLPLGVTYESWISREQFDHMNPMEKEAALIRYAVLEEDAEVNSVQPSSIVDADVLNVNDPVAYSLVMDNVVQEGQYLYTQGDAKIKVYLEDFEADNELYIQLQNMLLYDEGRADITVGDKGIQLRNANDSYYMGIDEFWVNVTKWQSDQQGNYFEICLPEDKTFSIEKINVYQHEIDYAAIEERKVNSMEHLEIGINRVSGSVNCEAPSLLMLSIPYGKGWSAYVDGVKRPIHKADVGFLAIELGEGNHEVVLKYMTPGLIPGCICAVISAFIIGGIWLKKGDNGEATDCKSICFSENREI